MKIQRKIIDIPMDILSDIGILAAMDGTDPKNYIQDNLITHVKKQRKLKNL